MVLFSLCWFRVASDSSCYPWFQVTDHATTALLHYQLPQMPDVVVRSFMVSGLKSRISFGNLDSLQVRASRSEGGCSVSRSPGPRNGRWASIELISLNREGIYEKPFPT